MCLMLKVITGNFNQIKLKFWYKKDEVNRVAKSEKEMADQDYSSNIQFFDE